MARRLTRRGFLTEVGLGTVAVAILGPACSDGTGPAGDETATGEWRRVDLGVVSAYVVAHSGEALVVDTGVEGSADDIEAAIAQLGLDWSAVGHVLLTHSHPDHAGSIAEVLARASGATGYVGEGDRQAVDVANPLTVVGDGDTILGLEVVETPGHTPGHLCVLDRELGLLIAGDALTGSNGGVAGPNARFTADAVQAAASVAKLAELSFDVVVFGHGDPLEGNASAQVAELAAVQ